MLRYGEDGAARNIHEKFDGKLEAIVSSGRFAAAGPPFMSILSSLLPVGHSFSLFLNVNPHPYHMGGTGKDYFGQIFGGIIR